MDINKKQTRPKKGISRNKKAPKNKLCVAFAKGDLDSLEYYIKNKKVNELLKCLYDMIKDPAPEACQMFAKHIPDNQLPDVIKKVYQKNEAPVLIAHLILRLSPTDLNKDTREHVLAQTVSDMNAVRMRANALKLAGQGGGGDQDMTAYERFVLTVLWGEANQADSFLHDLIRPTNFETVNEILEHTNFNKTPNALLYIKTDTNNNDRHRTVRTNITARMI